MLTLNSERKALFSKLKSKEIHYEKWSQQKYTYILDRNIYILYEITK